MRLVDIDDIRVMKFLSEEDDPSESDGEREYRNGWNDALTAINDIQPSAEPVREPDEWCTDCKEYDHDKHCCPRFNRVIWSALQDAELVRCKDCKWKNKHHCTRAVELYIHDNDFCSWAERRADARI